MNAEIQIGKKIKKELSMRYFILIIPIALLICFFTPLSFGSEIEDVYVSPSVINPEAGQIAVIHFKLPDSAKVSVDIYDFSHFHIKNLLKDVNLSAGYHRLTWDGKDEKGVTVPDEAYYFVIKSIFRNGKTSTFNSALKGGMYLGIIPYNLDRYRGILSYELPSNARVRIRAGIQGGALFKTVLDWVPQVYGNKEIPWNGTDDTGKIRIWDMKDFGINITAFSLPANTIFVVGSKKDFFSYWKDRAKRNKMSLINYIQSSQDASDAMLRARYISGALSYTTLKISEYYLMNRFMNRSPNFRFFIEGQSVKNEEGVFKVSGTVSIRVEMDEITRDLLRDQRYEVVLYIDGRLYIEDETGYCPYTFTLDTQKLTEGEHILTVNIATLSDQVGSWSEKIEIIK